MAKTAKEMALKILNSDMVGTMATVEENKPHSRYMTFFNEDFVLYTFTGRNTHKVDELKINPYTHILIGYEGKGFGDSFLEIEGKVEEADDPGLKIKLWNKFMKMWFEGPDDPNLIILKITPSQFRLMNKKGEDPVVIEFD